MNFITITAVNGHVHHVNVDHIVSLHATAQTHDEHHVTIQTTKHQLKGTMCRRTYRALCDANIVGPPDHG